jgi:hypothetical protein
MSNRFRKLSAVAVVAMCATSFFAVDYAEAGGTRRARTGNGIMRLGGPVNGTANGASNGGGIVDRTGGPSFTNQTSIRTFGLERFERGGGQN